MNVKDLVSKSLRSSVIYKFNCAECNSTYIGETSRHFSTRVREHLYSDKNSHVYKHLKSSDKYRRSCSDNSFTDLEIASIYNHVKLRRLLILCGKNLY